jgi:histidinol-phosphate phosphatase family protein
MQAIILAGGKGTRLAERLAGRPKPLIDVGGTPLLERQIRALEMQGIDDVVVLVNHAADQIRGFFAARTFAARVRIVDDGDPRGTAGAVLAMLDEMATRALIVYGDTLFDIDVAHMLAAHAGVGADATLLLHPNDHPNDSDLVALDADGYVAAFLPHPHPPGADRRNMVNAAFYVVEREALLRWRDAAVPSDFGHDLFPAMVAAGQRLFGHVSAEYIKDLGTPARLDKVERHLAQGLVARASRRHPQQAVFLDRDGTLNVPRGHIADPDAIALIPGAGAAVRRLNDAGLRTVLVTNQPVVARGDADLATLDRIHGRLESLLSEAGGYLDRIAFCPHHPHAGYPGEVAALKIVCDCRKPATGMIEDAVRALNIDRQRSWMIGDSEVDIAAAARAGLLSIRVLTGESAAPTATPPHATVADIAAAVGIVLDIYPALQRAAAAQVARIAAGDTVHVAGAADLLPAAVLRNELRAAGLAARLSAEDATSADVVLILSGLEVLPAGRTFHRLDATLKPEDQS